MRLLSSSLTTYAGSGWACQRCQQRCHRAVLARYLGSCPIARYSNRAGEQEIDSFEAAGIRPAVASWLRIAFPNAERPTLMQKKLIGAMLGKKDVVLQDYTGSGKSFTVMLALLSKRRVFIPDSENDGKKTTQKGITTLLIVPHRDLAFQYLHWVHSIVTARDKLSLSMVPSVAKVLVRGSYSESASKNFGHLIMSPSSDLSPLRRDPPHILICTPTAIMDVILRAPEFLHLDTLSTVVVDEVDSLLEWVPSHTSRSTRKKVQKKIEKHPMVLRQVMDVILGNQEMDRSQSNRDNRVRQPQLVFLSATMRSRLRKTLYGFGWLKLGHVVSLVNAPSKSHPAHGLNRAAIHHVLVVSEDGSIKNLPGAHSREIVEKGPGVVTNEDSGLTESEDDFLYEEDMMMNESDTDILDIPLAINPAMLEAVATTFALDVPQVALLVLPATASVRKVIFELRQLGVDAHALDLLGNAAEFIHLRSQDGAATDSPTLFVSTMSTTRGIDFPELSHVFLLGVPQGRSGDAYLHIAGRVGRFGRQGKVITVVGGRKEERKKKGKVMVEDEPKKMAVIMKQMGITPTRLEHFE
ncbi:P-loop containing nucleoside triphosphate hydrolase protein [Pisolithus croceorrhizus]|nr:P-loop containing nucleoside triphosphate hydrolase protein [Pisolithus croceorrhizus]